MLVHLEVIGEEQEMKEKVRACVVLLDSTLEPVVRDRA